MPAIIRFLSYLPFPPADSIGKQLTLARTVQGLSREAAARILDVDPGTLWTWESDQRTPSAAFLARIEAFLAMLGR